MKNIMLAVNRVLATTSTSYTDKNSIAIIQQNLEESAGTYESEPFYRVNYVIALQFWLDSSNNLIKGEGATFDQNFEVTRRYLELQKIQDSKLSGIPEEYSVDSLLNRVRLSENEEEEGNQDAGFGIIAF
ncbi:MAG: hypothetical protein AAF316_00245 [Cyanobacteria bacterium P01_A01_bin.80]